MSTAVAPPLVPWTPFYAMLASAGATLTALMFVVLTLISQARRTGTSQQVDAFGTPTIVHFCATILVAGTMTAPWRDLAHVAVALGLYGSSGVCYGGLVTRRALHQVGYEPVFEDWLWHSVIPIAAYATILGAAAALPTAADSALFFVAAATIALLFVGVHNSWDTLAYIAMQETEPAAPDGAPSEGTPSGTPAATSDDPAPSRVP